MQRRLYVAALLTAVGCRGGTDGRVAADTASARSVVVAAETADARVAPAAAAACGCKEDELSSPTEFVSYARFGDEVHPVVLDDIGGITYFGGDVTLGRSAEWRAIASAVEKAGGVARIQSNKALVPKGIRSLSADPWPNHVVPYTVSDNLGATHKENLVTAMRDWEKALGGGLTFRPHQTGDAVLMKVVSTTGSTCSWEPDARTLYLATDYKTCAWHELGHVLGLAHEQKRFDVGSFVKIKWENIDSNDCSQFRPLPKKHSDGLSYDLGSIMHYYSTANACRSGLTTLEAIPPGKITRTHNGISSGDVAGARLAQRIPATARR